MMILISAMSLYLTVSEVEILILSACLHDLGMVYTDEERQKWYDDETAYKNFLREYCPELLGCCPADWPEDIRQWYLRVQHPFRVWEVLQNKKWEDLFRKCPLDMVPKKNILAVCKAHGENVEEICQDRELEYLPANDADLIFCVLLLRLSDLLDFDDTRAPKVLYSYVENNEKSADEWRKHQASAGFYYPLSPSVKDLPYKARCTNPGVEHAVRDFLGWVDEELRDCAKLQKRCEKEWQRKFPFPRMIERKEIESDGYESGDFCLTMDQTQILKLLTGENIYDGSDVFVRELLQNAIDATLLRSKLDSDFELEKARIDFWEWNDAEGNIWFRIDDCGTGMTLGMLRRYFLKVGNSYYTSKELERDLREHGQTESYQGISRFGIGFLSCFLCGDYAEVSTVYFDPQKNRREESAVESYRTIHYGLNLEITGLTGYYTLKNQARQHPSENLPFLDSLGAEEEMRLERYGYRVKPGTSIVVRLDPGKLGAIDLRKTVEKYLYGSRVPVYYNKKRVGKTYDEIMRIAHKMAGEKIYELTPKRKEQFTHTFPYIRGNYPKIAVEVISLDTEENHALSGVSGVLAKYEVRFEQATQWQVKNQKYEIKGYLGQEQTGGQVHLSMHSGNVFSWESHERKYGLEKTAALAEKFEKLSLCPQSGEELGDCWLPFQNDNVDVHDVWKSYHAHGQSEWMEISFEELGCFDIGKEVLTYSYNGDLNCGYQGVFVGSMDFNLRNGCAAFLLLEEPWKPVVGLSRSAISALPIEVFFIDEKNARKLLEVYRYEWYDA